MAKPKSALEELVEAAFSTPVHKLFAWETNEGASRQRRVREAVQKLEALAPDMALAGEALADFVTWAVPLIETIKLTVDQESRDTFARVLAQAETDLATWDALGEA